MGAARRERPNRSPSSGRGRARPTCGRRDPGCCPNGSRASGGPRTGAPVRDPPRSPVGVRRECPSSRWPAGSSQTAGPRRPRPSPSRRPARPNGGARRGTGLSSCVVRSDPAAVPEVAPVPGQDFGRRRNKDPPSGLAFAAIRAVEPPREPRRRRIHAEGIDRPVAPEVDRKDAGRALACATAELSEARAKRSGIRGMQGPAGRVLDRDGFPGTRFKRTPAVLAFVPLEA